MAKLKIALCVPAYGHVHAKWAQCLTKMVAHFLQSKLTNSEGEEYQKEVETFFVSSSMLSESRHRLTAELFVVRGASGTRKTPSAKSGCHRRANSKARRVLPMPPTPTRVNKRASRKFSRAASSISRPTKGVSETGRAWGAVTLPGDSSRFPARMRSFKVGDSR